MTDQKASGDDEHRAADDDDAEQADERADDQAERVAEALGVNDETEGTTRPAGSAATEATEDPAAPPNRASRRREEALERRKKRKVAPASGEAAVTREGDDLPRDKNARAKELLLRRREQAKGGPKPSVQSALLPGEMVDDALARTASAFSKWFRGNWNVIQYVLAAAIVGGGGFLFWAHHKEATAGKASGGLFQAVAADRGFVLPDDTRSDEQKERSRVRIFKTADERAETALASYAKVVDEHPSTGVAILAKLGAAGVELERRQWERAIEAYAAVLATPLAAADRDVKARAIEGLGLAKEGKGDVEGALKSFKELEGVDAKGFKELAQYHQARLWIGKGDKEKATELLKTAREKLNAPTVDGRVFRHLEAMIDATLGALDPTAVPHRTSLMGPKGMSKTPEELERMSKQVRDAAEKKGAPGHED